MVAINPLSPGAQLRKGCSIAVAQVDAESPPGYDESTLSTWWTPMGLLKTSTGSNVSMRSRATNEGSAHNPILRSFDLPRLRQFYVLQR